MCFFFPSSSFTSRFGWNQTARASLALGYLKDERVHLNSPLRVSVAWKNLLRWGGRMNVLFLFSSFFILRPEKFSFKKSTAEKKKKEKSVERFGVGKVKE